MSCPSVAANTCTVAGTLSSYEEDESCELPNQNTTSREEKIDLPCPLPLPPMAKGDEEEELPDWREEGDSHQLSKLKFEFCLSLRMCCKENTKSR